MFYTYLAVVNVIVWLIAFIVAAPLGDIPLLIAEFTLVLAWIRVAQLEYEKVSNRK